MLASHGILVLVTAVKTLSIKRHAWNSRMRTPLTALLLRDGTTVSLVDHGLCTDAGLFPRYPVPRVRVVHGPAQTYLDFGEQHPDIQRVRELLCDPRTFKRLSSACSNDDV